MVGVDPGDRDILERSVCKPATTVRGAYPTDNAPHGTLRPKDRDGGEGTAVLEAGGPSTLRSFLHGHRRQEFVLVNPGPAQEARNIEEFPTPLGSG